MAMMRHFFLLAGLLLLPLTPALATAPFERDLPNPAADGGCTEDARPQRAIEECSRQLDNVQKTTKQRAIYALIRGRAFADTGEHWRAIGDLSYALREIPENAQAYIDRGNSYYALGLDDAAERDFNDALTIWAHPMAFYNKGVISAARGDFDDAARDFAAAAMLAPRHAPTFNNLCWVKARLGRYEQALEACNSALKLRPGHPGTLLNRGAVYELLGDSEHARADFGQAYQLMPEDADIRAAAHRVGLLKTE